MAILLNLVKSSADVISSSNESRACAISGFIEDRVLVLSSVPYRCLTSFGSAGLINLSQVNTKEVIFIRDDTPISSCNHQYH